MRTREFPVLAPADERLVERLAVGLGDRGARVLGYLLLREEGTEFSGEPASKLAVRVGTGLSGRAAADALARLEAADLVTATAIRDDSRGRPPKAWRADAGIEATVRRVYRAQADALLARAAEDVDAAATPTDGTNRADASPGELRLCLNWQPNPLQAPFYAARAAGDYRDLDVTVGRDDGGRRPARLRRPRRGRRHGGVRRGGATSAVGAPGEGIGGDGVRGKRRSRGTAFEGPGIPWSRRRGKRRREKRGRRGSDRQLRAGSSPAVSGKSSRLSRKGFCRGRTLILWMLARG